MPAGAQRFAVKPHAEVTLGKAMNLSATMEMTPRSSSAEFGADFGYTFFDKRNNRLEVNAGLGYRYLNATLNAGSFGYNYAAPAAADVDGNAYTRFCEVSNLKQKFGTGYVTLPVYLQYAYHCTPWMEVHALAGVKLGFNTGSSAKTASGSVYSYGVFAEYDDLVIDAPYLDDFGEVGLTGKYTPKANTNSVWAAIMVGAGLDFQIYGPVWFDLGVRYNAGLTNVFGKGRAFAPTKAANAPVSYTVADGTQVRALTDYVKSGRLSPLTLNIGVTVRF